MIMRNAKRVRHFRDLDVYRTALDAAMQSIELTTVVAREETDSLARHVSRSSRSGCA
jgi:hypothetical protein